MKGLHYLNPGLCNIHVSCFPSATSAFLTDGLVTKTRNEFEQGGPINGRYSRLNSLRVPVLDNVSSMKV